MEYRESEVDDELAYKYYMKKMGINHPKDSEAPEEDEYDDDFQVDTQQKATSSGQQQYTQGFEKGEEDYESSSGHREKIIGLDDSSDEELSQKQSETRNQNSNLKNYKTLSESSELEQEKFQVVNENTGLAAPVQANPRPTFGADEVNILFTNV